MVNPRCEIGGLLYRYCYMADITDIEVDGFVKQREELEKLMMSNPDMEKKVQKLIRKVLMIARANIGRAAEDAMKSDPRQAYKAVKTAVWRQLLGGSVSILNKKKAGTKFSAYEPPRTLQAGQRGGNRRERNDRTRDLLKYAGSDRGFVLRFLNAGTQDRGVNFTPDESRRANKWNRHPNTGNRGRIAARNFFGNRSHSEMEKASENLVTLINELIKQELK